VDGGWEINEAKVNNKQLREVVFSLHAQNMYLFECQLCQLGHLAHHSMADVKHSYGPMQFFVLK
jgi:hypothetical protein